MAASCRQHHKPVITTVIYHYFKQINIILGPAKHVGRTPQRTSRTTRKAVPLLPYIFIFTLLRDTDAYIHSESNRRYRPHKCQRNDKLPAVCHLDQFEDNCGKWQPVTFCSRLVGLQRSRLRSHERSVHIGCGALRHVASFLPHAARCRKATQRIRCDRTFCYRNTDAMLSYFSATRVFRSFLGLYCNVDPGEGVRLPSWRFPLQFSLLSKSEFLFRSFPYFSTLFPLAFKHSLPTPG